MILSLKQWAEWYRNGTKIASLDREVEIERMDWLSLTIKERVRWTNNFKNGFSTNI